MIKLFICEKYLGGLKTTGEGCGKLHRKMRRLLAEKNRPEKGKNNLDGTEKTLPWPKKSFFDSHRPCLNCKIGKTFMEGLRPEIKICPCGKEFFRIVGESWAVWNRRKYCREHSNMSAYQRDKELELLVKGRAHVVGYDLIPEAQRWRLM